AENFGTSFALRQSKHFILEGDEYDTAFFDKGPKFLHYFPDSVILTSVEFDHADIYKDLDAVKTSFKRLVNLVPRSGYLVAYDNSPEGIAEALASFQNVNHRLEVKPEVAGVTIIDDFAHHPSAIAETLKALRTRYTNRRLWAILAPRSNTLRRNVFFKELVASLANADEIVVASVFKAEAIPEGERLSSTELVKELNKRKHPARECKDADAIIESITPELREGDV